jgi:hypothetical protein
MPCGGADGGAPAAGDAARGGMATAGGVALADVTDDGGIAEAGGATGAFGGITTTEGGRSAATEAGVTIFGAGASVGGLGGAAFADAAGVSALASSDGAEVVAAGFAAGGRAIVRAAGSAVSFCWVMARSTSPGREMCDRSILVLISSSPRAAAVRDDFEALDPDSLRERRCFRTSSASCSSRELEWVFFSVTPTAVSESRISLLLTSSSRARSLIRIFIPLSFSSFSGPAT